MTLCTSIRSAQIHQSMAGPSQCRNPSTGFYQQSPKNIYLVCVLTTLPQSKQLLCPLPQNHTSDSSGTAPTSTTQQFIMPFTKEAFSRWVTLYTAGVITFSPGNLVEVYYGSCYTFRAEWKLLPKLSIITPSNHMAPSQFIQARHSPFITTGVQPARHTAS